MEAFCAILNGGTQFRWELCVTFKILYRRRGDTKNGIFRVITFRCLKFKFLRFCSLFFFFFF